MPIPKNLRKDNNKDVDEVEKDSTSEYDVNDWGSSEPKNESTNTNNDNESIDEVDVDDSDEVVKKTRKFSAFIDPQKRILRPFGSKEKQTGKRKLKTSDFDPRKNIERKANLVRRTVILLLMGILGVAIFQALFPPKPLTPQEVAQISAQQAGMTGYPLDSAEGFATDFMKAYLTVNNSEELDQILNYYYTGNFSEGGRSSQGDTRSASSSFNQKIITGPTVYKAESLTDSSGTFIIGAVTQAAPIEDGKVQEVPEDDSTAELTFFSVNVYWDSEKDAFAITPDSPTVVPASEVEESSEIPASADLGTGRSDSDLNDSVDSIVRGFISGYATSSPEDHSAMDQYIVSDAEPELKNGLNDRYALPDANQNVSFEAYPVEGENEKETNEVKVKVTVDWEDTVGDPEERGGGKVTYTSNYVMTLEKQSNGKYLVSKFAPLYYEELNEDE